MTIGIIITLCILLLLAYLFDISSRQTKIPSVILLLILGSAVRQLSNLFQIQIIDLNPVLPILGTIGLILIVLEGALELELNKSKISLIKSSLFSALVPMLILSFLFAFAFQHIGQVSFKTALLNTIPLCIISSAIAIPSIRSLSTYNKEFIIYESSMSDIFGVLFFNFIAYNQFINTQSFLAFVFQIALITIISFIAVLGLSFLLSRIEHHITFMPIILMVILIYSISKIYHLPGLLFILVFGLFLGNLDELKRYKWLNKFKPVKLDKEVSKFKEITLEATFLFRALFFILFGFLMDAKEIFNTGTLLWAIAIVITIILVRWIILKITKLPISPLLYIAPRGLITILLFLSILPVQSISIVNKALIVQIIVLSVLVMMFGLITTKKAKTI